jgi:hypothetical protein
MRAPITREFNTEGNPSVFSMLFRKPYRKVVYICGKEAALYFFVQIGKTWIPWCNSEYYCVETAPKFIRRHITGVKKNRGWFENGQEVNL